MKIIIQCSATKNGDIWTPSELGKFRVNFVAYPKGCTESPSLYYAHPDDRIPNGIETWRKYLIRYNLRYKKSSENPDGLLKSAELYKTPIYRDLANNCGWENTFILSAGWGLVRADFLLPYYDITFSRNADRCKKRENNEQFYDFDHLTQCENSDIQETIYFFGGKDYLPLLYKLTRNINCKKVIYYKAKNIPKEEGYDYIECYTNRRTNWHYSCAEKFMKGNCLSSKSP